MKIKLTPEKCIACGICQLKAPNIFDCHDNGIIKFTKTNNLEMSFDPCDTLLAIVHECPTGAIIVKDKNTNTDILS